jgi:hypothetical protein
MVYAQVMSNPTYGSQKLRAIVRGDLATQNSRLLLATHDRHLLSARYALSKMNA